MFRFTDEQLMVRQMVRKWVEAKLRPANDALERGVELPYDLFRDFMKTFGIPDMVRAAFERKDAAAEGGGAGGVDAALSAIMGIEMCRVSPGFYLAFGATL